MATLVLTAVGTALGGPVGGAIGSMIGQSIDHQLLAGPVRGPRLGDLTVQTSSYGTQVPKIYGTMRVAGTIIWATDLKESKVQTGTKGQPEASIYSYSVSLAVALSSRKIAAVRRIWADGKLLRGQAGDFKVETVFRFHAGGPDQQVDPLIASIEGISNTPAYRGLALAVFENLQLAEYGNRIPFLTFEVEADLAPVTAKSILRDVSSGLIASDDPTVIGGFAAYGSSARAAVEPLIDRIGIPLVDSENALRTPLAGNLEVVLEDDLGSSGGAVGGPRIERMQPAGRTLPTSLSLRYYDAARDFQMGHVRASISGDSATDQVVELPAVLAADVAKALVEAEIGRSWSKREQLTIRLPPRWVAIRPGAYLRFEGSERHWEVRQARFEEMAVVLELMPRWRAPSAISADPGRSLPAADDVLLPTHLELLELPEMADDLAGLAIHVAASAGGSRYRQVPFELSALGQSQPGATAPAEAVIGRTLSALPAGQPFFFDRHQSIVVELDSSDSWLETCTDEDLVAGANLAAIGDELVQFGDAIPAGPNRFSLSRLVRGRRGTEWAMATHSSNAPFVLITSTGLRRVALPAHLQGAQITVRPLGPADAGSAGATRNLTGEGLRPPSPVHIKGGRTVDGGLSLSWVRRSRKGWAWLDGVDAPLGEGRELYRISVRGDSDTRDFSSDSPALVVAPADIADLGTGPFTVEVQQMGDLASSRPAVLLIA